jgi:two-component system, OmpR family, phosphate regulon sensor histidine kinase PhoR
VRPSDGSPQHFVAQFIEADDPERSTEREQLFLQSVSHELRTPLTSIVGPLEMLLDRSDLPADVVRQLDTVRRNAARLDRQVADLLDVARMEEGRLELEDDDLDLATLARSVVGAWSGDMASADLALVYDGPRQLPVRADRDRLRQLLDHLVSNAVKFSDPGGRVMVRAWTDGAEVRLTVEDSGVGMDADEVDAVFGRFVRGAGARRRAARGTGIGLWVASNIARAHGGRVGVEHTGPDGTVVGVVLPGRAVETRSSAQGPTTLWMHSPDVAWVDSGEVVTALDLSDGRRPQALQGVAAVIWRVLAEPQSIESILDALADDFPHTDRALMRSDVEQFLTQLAEARLLATLED